MSILIVHKERNKLQYDGFTYGDWRQYVAFLPDNSAVCVRHSSLPAILMMLGIVMLTIPAMGAFMAYNGVPVAWHRIIVTAAIGAVFLIPQLIIEFTKWRLVVTVSEKMWPKGDGTYERSF